MNVDAETHGQRALRELAEAIGYSDGADGDDEGGIDALIDYKNALEDRLAGRIDAAAEIRRLADRRGSFRGTTYYVRLVNAERVLEQIAELTESDGSEPKGEPAYTVLGRYRDNEQTYITTVYTTEPSGIAALARQACSEESDIPLDELDLEIVAVFEGEPEVVARGDEAEL